MWCLAQMDDLVLVTMEMVEKYYGDSNAHAAESQIYESSQEYLASAEM